MRGAAGRPRSIARWLFRPDHRAGLCLAVAGVSPVRVRRRRSVSRHDRRAFLREKVRRFGFAVLDDVELLTRWLIEAGEPGLLERSVGSSSDFARSPAAI